METRDRWEQSNNVQCIQGKYIKNKYLREVLYLHGLLLCVSSGFLSLLLCVDKVGMGTFGLHGLILCVSEGILSE